MSELRGADCVMSLMSVGCLQFVVVDDLAEVMAKGTKLWSAWTGESSDTSTNDTQYAAC